MRRLVLGTAGHIDHGKTALVRALTGIDTDRLPEEKRRGITIDLGFASLPLGGDLTLGIIDVPGHEAFVRNMVAGASGIDIVMLVIAADEGVMPQTREHLAIVDLLGTRHGVIALTKSDLVEADWLELVSDDVRQLVAGTCLEDAAIVPVSARTGTGVAELTAALKAAAAGTATRPHEDLFRMPVDRAFTVRGTGTVITGTVWSGKLRKDAQVTLTPAGLTARVRGLQQHGAECVEVVAGARAAIAIAGVERRAVERGETAVSGAGWAPAGILTVDLQVVADAAAPIAPRQRVRVHIGTAEVLGRLGMIDTPVAPGGRALAQLRLESPVVARAGDRIVIRSYSPVITIAGGVVLEPDAPKRRRLSADMAAALRALRAALDARDAGGAVTAAVTLAGPEGLDRSRLPVLCGCAPAAGEAALVRLLADGTIADAGGRLVHGDRLAALAATCEAAVAAYHEAHPMQEAVGRDLLRRLPGPADAWLLDHALERLVREARLVPVGNGLARPGHVVKLSAEGERTLESLAEAFESAGLESPTLQELPQHLRDHRDLALLVGMLERSGRLLRLSADRWISARAVAESSASIRAQVGAGSEVDMAHLKDLLKLTRKHLIPLLEHFDRSGVTRREGDRRVLL